MLFQVWADAPYRPTRDLDLLGWGDDSPEHLAEVFRAICTQPAEEDDGLVFDVAGLRAVEIRESQEYGGVRVHLTADLAGARIPIPVDVGFGDAVTPGPIMIEFPTLLELPPPSSGS